MPTDHSKLLVDICLAVDQKPDLEVKFTMPPGYGDHISRLKVRARGSENRCIYL